MISAVNLRSVHHAIEEYVKVHQRFPTTFREVSFVPFCAPEWFISRDDPERLTWQPEGGPSYSSYAYKPAPSEALGDPAIVLVHEREAWGPLEYRMLSKRGRWTLFGDGQVRHLDDASFEESIARDKARRRERGWPTDVVCTPSTRAASQQANRRLAPTGEGAMK